MSDETMVSTMLSAAIKMQYSSVLPLLHHCLPVFDEICGTAMNFVFFVCITLITRKLCYCKDDRAMRPIHGCTKNLGTP